MIYAKCPELKVLLTVVQALTARLPRERRAGSTEYTAMSQAQRNALDGGPALLDKLYAARAK